MRRADRGRNIENGSARWMGLGRPQSPIQGSFVTPGDHESQGQNRPLTPTLSPSKGERENCRQQVGELSASSMSERLGALLPLPKEEGRGERELSGCFSGPLDLTISLWHSAAFWRSK